MVKCVRVHVRALGRLQRSLRASQDEAARANAANEDLRRAMVRVTGVLLSAEARLRIGGGLAVNVEHQRVVLLRHSGGFGGGGRNVE